MHPSATRAPNLGPDLTCATLVVRGDAHCQAAIGLWSGDDLNIESRRVSLRVSVSYVDRCPWVVTRQDFNEFNDGHALAPRVSHLHRARARTSWFAPRRVFVRMRSSSRAIGDVAKSSVCSILMTSVSPDNGIWKCPVRHCQTVSPCCKLRPAARGRRINEGVMRCVVGGNVRRREGGVATRVAQYRAHEAKEWIP